MRRSMKSTIPNRIASPMKCNASHAAQMVVLSVTAAFNADPESDAMIQEARPSATSRTSGCMMSPPRLAATAISPKLAAAQTKIAGSTHDAGAECRRYRHNPIHAISPLSEITMNASSAQLWWASINGTEAAGFFAKISCAALPVMQVGIAISAMARNTERGPLQVVAILRSAARKIARPRIIPTVGKWFSSK